jgi:NAD(P)-dependent dehydrogenase (short-subunit alcohol dehydrogenase family)
MSQPKLAIVTGAGSGIGKYSTFALWEAGYAVVLAGRRLDKLEQTVSEAGVSRDRALVVQTDVGDPESVKSLFATARQSFDHLDVVFNNAGVGAPPVPMEELSYEQWMTVVNVNLTGVFLCTQEAVRWMKSQDPQGGRIINNGSISAHVPRPFSAPYTATKHAVSGLTKSTGLDGRAYNIACSQIDIGNAATDMTQKMEQGILQANGDIKVEPTMDVRHVADAVVYMANLPLSANVPFMTVMATTMPYIGRG